MKALSIITAIHNALPMNRLFWTALSQNTETPFELIIIDNHSTDGSEAFFEKVASRDKRLVYVRNPTNQSYPVSQQQGMSLAKHDVLCFLNNDIWMPRGWHSPFERALEENPLLVLSPSGQEAQPTQSGSDLLKAKWKRSLGLSKAWRFLKGASEEERLWKALDFMYAKLDPFVSPTPKNEAGYFHGIKGDTVVFHRKLLEKIPDVWHERIEAADWHLYLTVAHRHELDPEIPLPRVLLDAYVHHFGRYSARRKPEPLPNPKPFLSIDEFWGAETVRRLWWGYQLPE